VRFRGGIRSSAAPKLPFSYAELRLPTRHQFGCVHLPDADQIQAIAKRIADPARKAWAIDTRLLPITVLLTAGSGIRRTQAPAQAIGGGH
jgi:hypothetical protein